MSTVDEALARLVSDAASVPAPRSYADISADAAVVRGALDAAARERAAAVTWLRAEAPRWMGTGEQQTFNRAADALQRGDHVVPRE